MEPEDNSSLEANLARQSESLEAEKQHLLDRLRELDKRVLEVKRDEVQNLESELDIWKVTADSKFGPLEAYDADSSEISGLRRLELLTEWERVKDALATVKQELPEEPSPQAGVTPESVSAPVQISTDAHALIQAIRSHRLQTRDLRRLEGIVHSGASVEQLQAFLIRTQKREETKAAKKQEKLSAPPTLAEIGAEKLREQRDNRGGRLWRARTAGAEFIAPQARPSVPSIATGRSQTEDRAERSETSSGEIAESWRILEDGVKGLAEGQAVSKGDFERAHNHLFAQYDAFRQEAKTISSEDFNKRKLETLANLKRRFEFLSRPEEQKAKITTEIPFIQPDGRVIETKRTIHISRSAVTKQGREGALSDAEMADMPLGDLYELLRDTATVEKKENFIRQRRPYQLLEQYFLSGMNLAQLRFMFANGKGRQPFLTPEISMGQMSKTLEVFGKDVESEKRNPLLENARKITLYFAREAGDQKLTEEDVQDKAKLRGAMLKYWTKFGYEAKLEKGTGKAQREPEARDIDVSTSLWLFEMAGFQAARRARAIAQGQVEAGIFMVDTGGRTGLFYESKEGQPPQMGIDNHSKGRWPLTSTAKGIYELLRQAGFLEDLEKDSKLGPAHRALKMMIELSVDDDNATFPIAENPATDYKHNARRLRGVSRLIRRRDLYEFLKEKCDFAKPFRDDYMHLVSGRELNEQEIKRFGLRDIPLTTEWVSAGGESKDKKQISHDPIESQEKAVRQADELLAGALDEEGRLTEKGRKLERDGRIFETRFGWAVLDLILPGDDYRQQKLLGGHLAAKAYGFKSYLSISLFDAKSPSFLLNSLDHRVDLSQDRRIIDLAAKQGALVRGAMLIKGGDREPLKLLPEQLLAAMANRKDWHSRNQGNRIGRFLETYKPLTELAGKFVDLRDDLFQKIGDLKARLPKINAIEDLQSLQQQFIQNIEKPWQAFWAEETGKYPEHIRAVLDKDYYKRGRESVERRMAEIRAAVEAKGKELVPPLELKEFKGNREFLEAVTKTNFKAFGDWLRQKLTNEQILTGLGPRAHALLQGKAVEYLQLVESKTPRGGTAEARAEILEEAIPRLLAWILITNKESSLVRIELKRELGEAYEDIGFKEVTADQLKQATKIILEQLKKEKV